MQHVIEKISNFSSTLAILGNFNIYLLQKKLMTSAYSRWCQHFFSFNLHYLGCLTNVSSYINIGLVLLVILRAGQKDPPRRTTFKKSIFIRVKRKSTPKKIKYCFYTHHFVSHLSEKRPVNICWSLEEKNDVRKCSNMAKYIF